MHTTPRRPLALLAALGLLAVIGFSAAGPLNPPGGPVAPTAKPLAEIEPRTPLSSAATPGDASCLFRITQPGSYYLAGNLSGASAKNAIEISASNVTLDLQGFQLNGGAGSLDGIKAAVPNLSNITIVNGVFTSWGGAGINLSAGATTGCRIVDVTSTDNAGVGIASGPNSTILRCTARANAVHGISTGTASVITNCTASSNVNGILAGAASTVTDCTANTNQSFGISLGTGSSIRGCTAYNNGTGLSVNTACTATGCTSYDNDGDGFQCSSGSTTTACTAYSNGGAGFNLGGNSTVTGCTARNNASDGIRASFSSCFITANACTSNGVGNADAANIRVTGGDCRIDGNLCATGDVGIRVGIGGSLIIRNTCANNVSNWEISTSNRLGPIVTAAAGGVVVSGNVTAASTLGTTDPFANFNY